MSQTNAVLAPDSHETYQALIRSLRRRRGFGLLFVRCSPAQGQQLIADVRKDIPRKKIEVLPLKHSIDNLYDIVESLPNKDQIHILFITGLEKSLTEYIQPGIGGQGDYYKLDTVPRILGHLNLQRERFRDNFNICFVFLLPQFALKYFVRRAPDFFDWRSGVLEFVTDRELVEQESSRLLQEGDYQKYLALTPQERNQKLLEIQELIDEKYQTSEQKAGLWFEQGNILVANTQYEEEIASYDQALNLKPDKDEAWNNRGFALGNLGRYEEAIASYDQALNLKPDKDAAWNNRGIALSNLGRYEEAIASYDQALKLKPDKDEAWY
ncbi:MAG: tetratricopeptide repeat protein, partial [Cyanothece sp. SIO1E1]|nr:tetratricopeptide repeat protein [Cyanothece sp. SIO1E1]